MLRRLAAVAVAMAVSGTSYLAGSAQATVDPGLTRPAAPTVTVSGETAHVTWAAVPGAGGYGVQVSLDGGVHWGSGGFTDAATTSVDVPDLRASSLGCSAGACSVIAQVEQIVGSYESPWSASSTPVALPLPFTIPMSVWRHNAPGRVTLVLYGASSHPGQVIHLFKLGRDRIWTDTGRTTTVHRQRVPGHARALQAWRFTIVVRAHGKSNYRVEIPAAGQFGEGTSRPYGVRL